MAEVRGVTWSPARVSPVAAEVTGVVRWSGEGVPPGRLTGPRSRYASTVEVAYPLRFGDAVADGDGWRADFRVTVPEPNPWHPEAPFLYDLRVGGVTVPVGLRTRSMSPAGLLWNGRPLSLRVSWSDQPVADQRRNGFNAVIASPAVLHAWDDADSIGMIVIGRLPADPAGWPAVVTEYGSRPCLLGWLVPEESDGPGEVAALRSAGHLLWQKGQVPGS